MLSDSQILEAIDRGEILIEPFNREQLGSNSYDVRLGDKLLLYSKWPLDPQKDNPYTEDIIPKEGKVLNPNVLYLATTLEYTETRNHVPRIDGKSSIGRLGISIHITAGVGDIGFCGNWTLEISVKHPVIVYPGMLIGQIYYYPTGPCLNPYNTKQGSKYNGQREPRASMMYLNFETEKQ